MKTVKITAEGKSGTCPICNSDISYTGSDRLEEIHHWICDHCGANGKESYTYIEGRGEDDDYDEWEDTEFVEHCDVHLKDGTPVELIAPEGESDFAPCQLSPAVSKLFEKVPACTRSFQFMLPPFGRLDHEIMVCVEYWQQAEPGILTYHVYVQPVSASTRYSIGKAICRCPVLYDLNQAETEAEAIILDLLQTKLIMEGIQDWYSANKQNTSSDCRTQLLRHIAGLKEELQIFAASKGCVTQALPIEIAIETAEDLLQKLF